ncbi:MAG: NAD-dependent deacylase, partial [Flavobacteriales bacterium]|nr:NAD-dependent deacylase [Flavobacteriales bacterium]
FLVVGTSMSVYPAAGLIHYIPENCKVYLIDPNLENTYSENQNHFKTTAVEGMKLFRTAILEKNH